MQPHVLYPAPAAQPVLQHLGHKRRGQCTVAGTSNSTTLQQLPDYNYCNGHQHKHTQRYHHLEQQQRRLQQRKQQRIEQLKQQPLRDLHHVLNGSLAQPIKPQGELTQQQDRLQDLPWYRQPHPEQLRAILKMPPYRFQTFVQQQPSVLSFLPDTLMLTLESLGTALHANHKAVVGMLEDRPCILLKPHEPVEVLHTLAQLLQRSSEETAFLLSPYPQLLSLAPSELQQRIQELCHVMHWPNDQPKIQEAAAATGVAFLHLLATPVKRTAQQLTALAAALDAPEATCAILVQKQPHLLQMSPAVLRSRVFALSEVVGTSCCKFLQQLDHQQLSNLASLILLSPSRLLNQINSLQCLLGQHKPASDVVALLLELGSPHAVADAKVKWVALQSLVRDHALWEHELITATPRQLGAFLSVSHDSLAQVRFIVTAGLAAKCGMKLIEVVQCPAAEFKQQFGQGYARWLAGKS